MKLSGHLFHDMTSIKWVSAHKEGQEKSGSLTHPMITSSQSGNMTMELDICFRYFRGKLLEHQTTFKQKTETLEILRTLSS